jgi:hypothetical protein
MICHLPHPVAAAPVFGGAYSRIVGAIMRQKQDGAGYIRINIFPTTIDMRCGGVGGPIGCRTVTVCCG